MNRYAVLDNDTGAPGKITNIAVATAPMNDGWLLSPPDYVQAGWSYDGTQYIAPEIYFIGSPQFTANALPMQYFSGLYYCQPGDTVRLQANIVDGNGDIVTSLNIPVTVKLPLVKHVNGQPYADEIYLSVTLINGVLDATGVIPSSGDWKLIISRCNEAVSRIGAQWRVSAKDVTFIV